MDFRHLIVTCLFSMLRLSFETQKIKENYAIFNRKNTRSDSLHIYYIVSSCDCLETRCSKYHAAPGDTLQLKVSFQSDSIGVFVRELYIYGNFPSLPLSLTVEGDCI